MSDLSEPLAIRMGEASLSMPLDQAATREVTSQELDVLADALNLLYREIASQWQPQPCAKGRPVSLATFLQRMRNIGDAASIAGLSGFVHVYEAIQAHTELLPLALDQLSTPQRMLLADWPLRSASYLHAPNDPTAAQALADLATDVAWSTAQRLEDLAGWVTEMTSVQVIRKHANEERATKALAEHVDLTIPADIDRQVLDCLLTELPQHAMEFSGLMQRLLCGGTLDDIEHARRVAHTLKGAASTVGVKGVANLTHVLEDILSALGQAKKLPTSALLVTLVEASDCLEAMSEALLSGASTPTESLAMHQKVLDWANRLDRDEWPASHEDSTTRPPAIPAQDSAADSDDSNTYLRVPASLIDSLLQLAGDNSSISSQMQECMERMGENFSALRAGSHQFTRLSTDLAQQVEGLENQACSELNMLSRRLVESSTDSAEVTQALGRELVSLRKSLAEKERLQFEIERRIQRTRMVEVASILPRLQRTVRQASRMLGRAVNLQIVGEGTLVDRELLGRLLDPLMHLLRNAVDHGIEPIEDRTKAAKAPVGAIVLTFSAEGSNVSVRCEDDGRGLDLAEIRSKAVASGLVGANAELSDAQVMHLILLPGFSTRTEATLISGRGIGMDVVQRAVAELRGTLDIQFELGVGARFDMHFPVRMTSTQVMLSGVAPHVYAISVRGVEQILPARDALQAGLDSGLIYHLQGQHVPAMRLETLLGLPPGALKWPGMIEVVLVIRDQGRQRVAIIVPELSDSCNVVVKPFSTTVPRRPGIEGVTILEGGTVANVLDIPDLLQSWRTGRLSGVDMVAPPKGDAQPLCLIVDDSLSARRATQKLAQEAGYEVALACDGIDALGFVQRRTPDIVLLDLSMPRMDGLALTRALRHSSTTHQTPVVMITACFTTSYRELAEQAGVNVFLTKPFAPDLLLSSMTKLLHKP